MLSKIIAKLSLLTASLCLIFKFAHFKKLTEYYLNFKFIFFIKIDMQY